MKGINTIFLIVSFFLLSGVLGQSDPNLVALGNQAMNNGNYREAQDYYQAALVKEPQNWNINTLLGFCYHKQRRFKDADSIFILVIKNDSLSSKPYWYKGMNHIALRQDSMAILMYKKFIKLEKGKGGSLIEAYRSVGQCYERLLRKTGLLGWEIDDMIFHYEEIERADPSYVEVPQIRNFVEMIQKKRPSNQVGRWKLEA